MFMYGFHNQSFILNNSKAYDWNWATDQELRMFFFHHAYFALLKFQHWKEGSWKYDGDSDQI